MNATRLSSLIVLGVMASGLCVNPAHADRTVRETVQTSHGSLSIACEERIMFGDCILVFNDFVLMDEDLRLSFDPSVGQTGSYYLVHVLSGGVSCPAMLKLIDLNDPATPLLSGEFGTCSDAPVVTLTPKGELDISVPYWQGNGMVRWRYHKGALRRLK